MAIRCSQRNQRTYETFHYLNCQDSAALVINFIMIAYKFRYPAKNYSFGFLVERH
jgi:hypothetical protein